jgi:hypothetical protein
LKKITIFAKDIIQDFKVALEEIKLLSENSKKSEVYVAYRYYSKLTTKINYTPVLELLNERIPIFKRPKNWPLISNYITNKLSLA